MNKKQLLELLNRRDLPGVGVIAWTGSYQRDKTTGLLQEPENKPIYYFYEDFPNNPGIDRAAAQFHELLEKGKFHAVDYIHKDHKTIHFFDWYEKPGTFCAQDEFIAFNKSAGLKWFIDHFFRFTTIINGLEYKYDYTPAVNGISAITAELKNK